MSDVQAAGAMALVGSSGFVGTTLARQATFARGYRSTNIDEIRGTSHDVVVCCAAPAQKWIANREPGADRANLDRLISSLQDVSCRRFVLISTVDVFAQPVGVDEATPVDEHGLHPYGLHRRQLEQFVEARFADHLIVRLPGLVGPGLRKNVIYDFAHHNNLDRIDSRGVFQFYPMVNLWFDIRTALAANLKLVHLTAAPVRVGEVAALGFGVPFDHTLTSPPATYDMRTRHAALFGGSGHYQYSQRESIQAIRAYAQSERLATGADGDAG